MMEKLSKGHLGAIERPAVAEAQPIAASSREVPLEELQAEARYRRERLALYRARMYGRRASSPGKLRELQLSSDGAAARLRRAEDSVSPAPSARPRG